MDLSVIQEGVYGWASEKIPDATWRGMTRHITKEVKELEKELKDLESLNGVQVREIEEKRELVAKEISDIIILACHIAGKLGINLEKHVIEKMEINKSRLWSSPDPSTGIIHHIIEDEITVAES